MERKFLVIVVFLLATEIIVATSDLFIGPMTKELLLEPRLRNWCGVFEQCGGQAQVTFLEYVKLGGLWNSLHGADVVLRLWKGAVLGFLIGIGYVAVTTSRRG